MRKSTLMLLVLWIYNYAFIVITYKDTVFFKVFLFSLCMLYVITCIGLPLMQYCLIKNAKFETVRNVYKRKFYMGRYRALIENYYTPEEVSLFLDFENNVKQFRERNLS